MSTITKERVANLLQFNSEGSDCQANAEQWEVHELARIALASLEAEKSILYRERNPYNGLTTGWQELTDDEYEFIKDNAGENAEFRTVFTAPPAPVSVMDEAQSRELFEKNCMANIERNKWHPDLYAHLPAREQWAAWEACRAAMLQGAENAGSHTTMKTAPALDSSPKIAESPSGINQGKSEPVTTGFKLPIKMTPEMMRAVQVNSELGAYVAANLAGAYDLFAEFWDVACRTSGYSPVIPEGWVMVPAEPTAEMISSGITAHYERSQIQIHDRPAPGPMECAYAAMLAAAPQQEVKQ